MDKKGTSLRRLNARGQLYLDKKLARALVNVTTCEPGVWEVRQVPAHEVWLHQPATQAALERAITWSLIHSPTEADFKQITPAKASE